MFLLKTWLGKQMTVSMKMPSRVSSVWKGGGGVKTTFKDGGKVHSMCGYLLQWLRSLMLS